MYGIFTYIWAIFGANVGIHIPYMEHLGYVYIIHLIDHFRSLFRAPETQAALPGSFAAGALRLPGAPGAGGRRHQWTADGATGGPGKTLGDAKNGDLMVV